jgi:hypothetical protein
MKAGKVIVESVRHSAKPGAHAVAAQTPVKGGNGQAKPNGKLPAPVPSISRQSSSADSPEAAKPAPAKKVKMVQVSLAIAQPEYALLQEMKLRAGRLAAPAKKKMLIRSSIVALAALSDAAFLRAIQSPPSIKARSASKGH